MTLQEVSDAYKGFVERTGYYPERREFEKALEDAFEVATEGWDDWRRSPERRREVLETATRNLSTWLNSAWDAWYDEHMENLALTVLEKHRSAIWAILRGREVKERPAR